MRFFTIIFGLFFASNLVAQILPAARATDWTLAGYRGTMPVASVTDASSLGLVGDGTTNNSAALQAAILTFGGQPFVLDFPAGNFLFNAPVTLPSNAVLRGHGADSTLFSFNLGGTGHCISASGNAVNADTSYFVANATKDSMAVLVNNPTPFHIGDFVKIIFNDSSLCYSTWAYKNIGQILKISNIVGNRIEFDSPLRKSYDLTKKPYLVRLNMKQNIGLECLKIKRLDATVGQTSNVNFSYVANSWITGVESENCNFAHFQLDNSTNLVVRKCYVHHAFAYGGGGQGYGVQLGFTSGECLIEDNVFQHLRHSVILQAGVNGNVIAYNYSFDPFWSEGIFPSNSAGELVLHGNYPYLNLFEGNIVQNIVIDNSHAANGEYNTFLRNRADFYGIFFSDATSPNQNFIGNEITAPSPQGYYLLQGTGHFEYGNNVRGTVTPAGTSPLSDLSYYYPSHPSFLPTMDFAAIGIPAVISSGSIPAKVRQQYSQNISNICNRVTTPRIFLGTTTLNVPEDTGVINVPIRITNVNDNNTNVQTVFDVAGSTALNSIDADFCSVTSGICITAWGSMDNSIRYLTLQIVDDLDIESTETIRIRLSQPSNNALLTQDSILIINIIDNDTLTNLQQLPTEFCKIYPNPANDLIFIELQQPADQIELYNTLGQLLKNVQNNTQLRTTLNVQDLPKGTYFVRVYSQQRSFVQAIEIR